MVNPLEPKYHAAMWPALPADQELASLVTGRDYGLLDDDLRDREAEIRDHLGGRRVLLVGGAGSIGSATAAVLSEAAPRALHVIDRDENGLTELIRDLRSSGRAGRIDDIQMLPLDCGSPLAGQFLGSVPGYDVVLDFAALKHVRSEKDPFSLVQMLDTNTVCKARLLNWIVARNRAARLFVVSTDKAADPVNFMGASKRVLEHILFSDEVVAPAPVHASSTRFANVAFSAGSLLEGFLRRLAKRQPLTCPRETGRYFMSLREAGGICLLAAVCAPHQHIVVPRLDPGSDVMLLEDVADRLLRHLGFEPAHYGSEDEARERLEDDLRRGRYPLLLTALDTSGEKTEERFVAEGERVVEIGLTAAQGVVYLPTAKGTLPRLLERIEAAAEGQHPLPEKTELAAWMREVVPEFQHRETGKDLDHRM
jgi:FlaA1/EpsC-like NDP-sugar epimerase